jgi:uncharacterized protein YbaA (DUF1428 family)
MPPCSTDIHQLKEESAMTYVDGSVAAVPTRKKAAYLRHAVQMGSVFKDYGALSVVDCWGDDVPDGEHTSFRMAVQCRDDETVVFSWITWPSREAREEGLAKAMQDPRIQPDVNPLPFDGKRLIFGGFQMVSTV